MSFLCRVYGRGTKNLGLTHAVVPHKMYSLSKYRGKDARVWKNRARESTVGEGEGGGERARRGGIVEIVKNTAAVSSILSSTISVLVAAFRRYQFSGERQ